MNRQDYLAKTVSYTHLAVYTKQPKYSAWVRAVAGSQILKEGAARIAAIQRTQFEITHFIPSQEIKSNPSEVGSTFPAPLVPEVLSLAGAAK